MSAVLVSQVRLTNRISSLVSLTSVLVQIQPISCLQPRKQPISSLQANKQPVRSLHTSRQKSASSLWSPSQGRELPGNCPIRGREGVNGPISDQYMCGNSYSSMASSSSLTSAKVMPSAKHTATVIFLHGLGDQGYGWAEGFEAIKEPHIKYLFPNAPNQRVTLNFGMVMPSWFDIRSLAMDGEEDTQGILNSSKMLLDMVAEEEKQGISADRIIIGGFSQGGGVSLYTSLKDDRPYAGVLALSTWLPLHSTFKRDGTTKRALPILQCHGTADAVLNYKLGEMTHKLLETQVQSPKFNTYPGMGHSSCPEEMDQVRDFIRTVLPATP